MTIGDLELPIGESEGSLPSEQLWTSLFPDSTSKPLFDLGPEVSSQNLYEAELHAASGLVQETKHLYSKILIAAFPG